MKDVLVLIPAYNEEASIGGLLQNLRTAHITDFADLLVVNDASWDQTSRIVKHHNVTIISNVFNMGYGSALQLGYKYAVRQGYRYVIQLDADGQHDVCNIAKLYECLRTKDATGRHPDIVIGSRFFESSQSFPISPIKLAAIKMFRQIVRMVTGQTILDPTSGLQGLNCKAFRYYSLFENFNPTYPDANMIIQMIMLGFRIQEIPSVMHEREAGVSMHSGLFRPLTYMLTMPLSMFSIYYQVKQGLKRKLPTTLETQRMEDNAH